MVDIDLDKDMQDGKEIKILDGTDRHSKDYIYYYVYHSTNITKLTTNYSFRIFVQKLKTLK